MKPIKEDVPAICLVGLGANLNSRYGAPVVTLLKAAERLAGEALDPIFCSNLYISKAIPFSDQPDFINAAIGLRVAETASAFLHKLHAIEEAFGRTRFKRWEARVLDLDLLTFGDEIKPSFKIWTNFLKNKDVTATLEGVPLVPHIRLHLRPFVLKPMIDIMGGAWCHPALGMTLNECMAKISQDDPVLATSVKPLGEVPDEWQAFMKRPSWRAELAG